MIKSSILFALLLQDDFSGADLIGGGHVFYINGRAAHPIRKPEGYYVFLGRPEKEVSVTIHSAKHLPKTILLRVDTLSASEPVVQVRLFRKGGYYFPDCEWLSGQLRPGLLAVAVEPNASPLYLKGFTAEEEPAILLQGYTLRVLCGQRFCVGNGKNRELFVFGKRRGDGSYEADHKPIKKHVAQEPVSRVFCAPCDEQGRFSIPLLPGAGQAAPVVAGYDPEVRKWVDF